MFPNNRELQERRVPTAALHALWETAVRELGDRAFALRCARYPLSEARSVVLFACTAKETIGDCLEAAIRYWRLGTDDLAWALEERGDDVVMRRAPRRRASGRGARTSFTSPTSCGQPAE